MDRVGSAVDTHGVEYGTDSTGLCHAHVTAITQVDPAALVCHSYVVGASFWFDDSKTRGAAERCHRQAPKESLRLPKI
jgi:hypothetical protein